MAASIYVLLAVIIVKCVGLVWAAGPSAIYIFGDSTVDVGTNNYLNGTTALANMPYNGIDFPGSVPTGRFSNGYNLADQLTMLLLGYESSPHPYLYLVNNMFACNYSYEILRGVNFGSGGSGILDETGKIWKKVVPMSEQIQQFSLVRQNISELKGEKGTYEFLSDSIFLLSFGSNDILDNFRLKLNLTKHDLMSSLHSAYQFHLKNLYDMGARKFGIIPSGLLGCCPYSRALNKSSGGCMKEMNQFSKAFYTTVNSIFRNMSSQFPDFHYSLANIYSMTRSVLKNYRLLGFNETKKACCGSGYDNGEGFCNKEQMSNLCDNRAVHLFWDLYHPSQAATNFSAATLLYGERPFVSPVNFSTLAGLKA